MIRWSLTAEYLALILAGIMFLYLQGDRGTTESQRRKLFQVSLALLVISISLNIVCTELLEGSFSAPRAVTLALNSLYFLSTLWQASALALYVFDLLLEHVSGMSCRRRALVGTVAVNVAFLALILVNVPTGLVFSLDAAGHYVRGPFYLAGYAGLALLLVLLFICYVRNHASTGPHIRRVMWTMPPVVIALVGFQIAFPFMLLNGTIGAFSALIVLLNFQSQRLDTDSLTFLGDRKSFNDELALRTTNGEPFQILSIALRDFGAANRRFGHRRADELLYHVGTWLAEFDPKGLAFRYGKVSFAIVRPYTEPQEAERALESLAARFDGTWPVQNEPFHITACCCSLVREKQPWDAEQIIDYLDAMNERGKRERLRTVRFDEGVERYVERRRYLTEALSDGIEARSFRVRYQPVLSCASEQFEHAEALLRLVDRDGRPVPTSELVSLAEELGRIDEVSWIMIEEVCRFLAANPSAPAVSVNLSMPQLLDAHLGEHLAGLLEAHQVAPERLKIEITERVLAASAQEAGEAMARLAQAGVGCLLDDFGTGYANFSLVMDLPFEAVKIDRSILADITNDAKDRAVVGRIVKMFHDMGMDVVAEGIETREQADVVRTLGVDSIQGYCFAKPLTEEELAVFLAEHTPSTGQNSPVVTLSGAPQGA